MERPGSRLLQAHDDMQYEGLSDLERERHRNDMRLKGTFEHIFAKYSRDFSNVGDEIDLRTGEIVVDNGHIVRMANERDTGDHGAGNWLRSYAAELQDEEPETEEYYQDTFDEQEPVEDIDSEPEPEPLPHSASHHRRASSVTHRQHAREPERRSQQPSANIGHNAALQALGESIAAQIAQFMQTYQHEHAVDPIWAAPPLPPMHPPARRPTPHVTPHAHRRSGLMQSPIRHIPGRSIWEGERPVGRPRRSYPHSPSIQENLTHHVDRPCPNPRLPVPQGSPGFARHLIPHTPVSPPPTDPSRRSSSRVPLTREMFPGSIRYDPQTTSLDNLEKDAKASGESDAGQEHIQESDWEPEVEHPLTPANPKQDDVPTLEHSEEDSDTTYSANTTITHEQGTTVYNSRQSKYGQWTKEASDLLWELKHIRGMPWSEIAPQFPERPLYTIKNHWFTQLRPLDHKRTKTPLVDSSPGAAATYGQTAHVHTHSTRPNTSANDGMPHQQYNSFKSLQDTSNLQGGQGSEETFDTGLPAMGPRPIVQAMSPQNQFPDQPNFAIPDSEASMNDDSSAEVITTDTPTQARLQGKQSPLELPTFRDVVVDNVKYYRCNKCGKQWKTKEGTTYHLQNPLSCNSGHKRNVDKRRAFTKLVEIDPSWADLDYKSLSYTRMKRKLDEISPGWEREGQPQPLGQAVKRLKKRPTERQHPEAVFSTAESQPRPDNDRSERPFAHSAVVDRSACSAETPIDPEPLRIPPQTSPAEPSGNSLEPTYTNGTNDTTTADADNSIPTNDNTSISDSYAGTKRKYVKSGGYSWMNGVKSKIVVDEHEYQQTHVATTSDSAHANTFIFSTPNTENAGTEVQQQREYINETPSLKNTIAAGITSHSEDLTNHAVMNNASTSPRGIGNHDDIPEILSVRLSQRFSPPFTTSQRSTLQQDLQGDDEEAVEGGNANKRRITGQSSPVARKLQLDDTLSPLSSPQQNFTASTRISEHSAVQPLQTDNALINDAFAVENILSSENMLANSAAIQRIQGEHTPARVTSPSQTPRGKVQRTLVGSDEMLAAQQVQRAQGTSRGSASPARILKDKVSKLPKPGAKPLAGQRLHKSRGPKPPLTPQAKGSSSDSKSSGAVRRLQSEPKRTTRLLDMLDDSEDELAF